MKERGCVSIRSYGFHAHVLERLKHSSLADPASEPVASKPRKIQSKGRSEEKEEEENRHKEREEKKGATRKERKEDAREKKREGGKRVQ